jgi:cystathionine gamma-synthase/methionine-gamma-lyase
LKDKSFSTRAVHAGEHTPPGDYTPVVNPIYATVGYLYDSTDDLDAIFGGTKAGYVYPRYGSPTLTTFEAAMADLEEGEAAIAFASGMAAVHAALLGAGVKAGSHVMAALDIYGATYSMANRLFRQLGATASFVDVADLGAVETALAEMKPAALIVETISNPLLKVADVPALAELARHYQTKLLVDNTFASPYLCRPLAYGVDYVIHSATKFLSGHGDVMAGVVVTSAENRQKLFELNIIIGGSLGPFEAWLARRGLKTLPLRVRQQCQNALDVARWLADHPKIAQVNYPGLAGHPQHDLARRLFGERGFGGVLSFEIAGADQPAVFRFLESIELCLSATTLGDIYSLIMHPATTSHRSLSAVERAQVGIKDSLLRLSVGIEDVNDIIADLERALERV